MRIVRTKSGLPALWEEGGGYTSTGFARLIAGPNGEKLRPIYTRTRGHLACGEHALFVIKPGYLVVEASRGRDPEIAIYRIEGFNEDEAKVTRLHHWSMGEWDVPPPAHLEPLIKAAKAKARDYHCRSPYWLREEVR
jgi:hypothetical protein